MEALSPGLQLPAMQVQHSTRPPPSEEESFSSGETSDSLTNRQLIAQALERVAMHEATIDVTLTSAATRIAKSERMIIPWKSTPGRLRREIIGASGDHSKEPTVRLDVKNRASLVRSIARGRAWLQEIVSGTSRDVAAIALREHLTVRSVQMTVSLALLSPSTVSAAVEGKLPSGFGQRLLKESPLYWERPGEMF
jgi:hypothetical protein